MPRIEHGDEETLKAAALTIAKEKGLSYEASLEQLREQMLLAGPNAIFGTKTREFKVGMKLVFGTRPTRTTYEITSIDQDLFGKVTVTMQNTDDENDVRSEVYQTNTFTHVYSI